PLALPPAPCRGQSGASRRAAMITTATAAQVTGVAVIDLGWSDEAALYGYSSAAAVIPVLRDLGLEVFYLRLDPPGFVAGLLALRGRFEVAFPTPGGAFGEDGKLRGLLEIVDIPYVGSGVAASAIGMHKGLSKRLLRDLGLPVADGVAVPFPVPPPTFREARSRLGIPVVLTPPLSGGASAALPPLAATPGDAHDL